MVIIFFLQIFCVFLPLDKGPWFPTVITGVSFLSTNSQSSIFFSSPSFPFLLSSPSVSFSVLLSTSPSTLPPKHNHLTVITLSLLDKAPHLPLWPCCPLRSLFLFCNWYFYATVWLLPFPKSTIHMWEPSYICLHLPP